MMKTVLITGANGALGRAVVKQLMLNKQHRVVASGRNLLNKNQIDLDVTDKKKIKNIIFEIKPELIIHLAATFSNNFKKAYLVNVESSRIILEAIQQNCFNTRVVLIGSAAEYGKIKFNENPVSENQALRPLSVYGLTKSWQSLLAGKFANNGIDVVVARIFNLYGPNLSDKLFVGRLNKEINEVLSGKKKKIEIGPLNSKRDYLSIDIAAEQLLTIAEKGSKGEVYHIASGKPILMRDLLKIFLRNKKISFSIVKEASRYSNHKGYDLPLIYADVSRTKILMNLNK